VTDALVMRRLAHQHAQAAKLEERLVHLLAPLEPDVRACDVGCGTGALACALAPHVAAVVGIDAARTAVEAARAAAPANCRFEVGDATSLPFRSDEFSLGGCLRVLHHVPRPDRVVSELARVTRAGGTILIVDQLGSPDQNHAAAMHAFEQARDPSHELLLTDVEIRALLDTNNLWLRQAEITTEFRELEAYLDLVGLEGTSREHVRALAQSLDLPPTYEVEVCWYVAQKPE
jgi:ubiquinone/menaquinone biosynthesis C-methylase UbiE